MAGDEITVATTNDDGARGRLKNVPLGEVVQQAGIAHIFFRRDIRPYKMSFGLSSWLKKTVTRFDVVHIHALFSFASWAASRAAGKARVPYIVRPLGVLNQWGLENRRPLLKQCSLRLVELPILRRAAAIHYTTQAERSEAVKIHPDIANLPSFVVPIPVDGAPSETASEFFRQFPSASGKNIILFMSRLDLKKGIELLFQAFALIQQDYPDAILVIAGAGEPRYVESLRQTAKDLGIAQDVVWTGFLEGSAKASALAAATLFVLPSYSENFGIAAAEALAAGLACVLSEQVALSEYLEHDRSAMIVVREKEAIANAIRQLLADPQKRILMAERGREVAINCFSSKAVGSLLREQYRSISAPPR